MAIGVEPNQSEAQAKGRGQYIPKRPYIVNTAEASVQQGMRLSGCATLSKEAMLAAAAVMCLEPVVRSTDTDIKLRYYSLSRVQQLFGLMHPRRTWSRSPEEQHVPNSPWAVLLGIETESDAARYRRPRGRPRKSALEQQ